MRHPFLVSALFCASLASVAAAEEPSVAVFFNDAHGRSDSYGKKLTAFLTGTLDDQAFEDDIWWARHRMVIRSSAPATLTAMTVTPHTYLSAEQMGFSIGSPSQASMAQEYFRRFPEAAYAVTWRRTAVLSASGVSLSFESATPQPWTLHPEEVTGSDCEKFIEFDTVVSGEHIGDGVWGFIVAADVAADRICFYNDLSTITGHTFVGFRPFSGIEEVFGKYPSGSIFGSPGDFRDDSTRQWDSRNCRYVDRDTFQRALARAYLASVNREEYDMLSSNCTSFAVDIATVADIDPGFVCGTVCSPTEFHERIAAGYDECSVTEVLPRLLSRGQPTPDAVLDVDALARLTIADPSGAGAQTLVPFVHDERTAVAVPPGSAVRVLATSPNGNFLALAKASWNSAYAEGADTSIGGATEGTFSVVLFDRTGLYLTTVPIIIDNGAAPLVLNVSTAAGPAFDFPVDPPGNPVLVAGALLIPAVLTKRTEPTAELDRNGDGVVDWGDGFGIL